MMTRKFAVTLVLTVVLFCCGNMWANEPVLPYIYASADNGVSFDVWPTYVKVEGPSQHNRTPLWSQGP